MNTLELILRRDRTTKSYVRFTQGDATGQPLIVGSVYVNKTAAGAAKTARVVVQLDGASDSTD